MRRITFLLFGYLAFFCFPENLTAQKEQIKSYRNYGTIEVMQRLEKENPEVRENKKKIEQHTAKYMRRGFLDSSVVLTVPMVFHIIESPEMERISPDMIYAQIEALNRDFGEPQLKMDNKAMTKEDFAEKAASMGITFCLPFYDANGRETTGVNYHQTNKVGWTTDDAIKGDREGGIAVWDTKSYLNIYVAALEDGLTGYAQMPGGPAATDGIVIDYRYFGSQRDAKHSFVQGKTLTHLVGNYLNLYPLWGEARCKDDYVFDTPVHNAPNYGCWDYKHYSLCHDKKAIEMTMNFMDGTDDDCAYMFTHGQKRRVEAAFAPGGTREGLLKTEIVCEERKIVLEPNISQRNGEANSTLTLDARIFPNPAKDELNIVLKTSAATKLRIAITDALGRKIYEESVKSEGSLSKSINCRNWETGLYYLLIQEQGGAQVTQTFNVQH